MTNITNFNLSVEEDEVVNLFVDVNDGIVFNLAESIVVTPIPSNYGLITWDGSVLIVS